MSLPRAARDASARWSRQLASWAIPESVLAAAPESPWGFPPGLFARSAGRALADPEFTPSRRRATEAIPRGGSVLDVGAGGGAASLPLTPPAGVLIAVDESQAMLDVFAQGAECCGVRAPHGDRGPLARRRFRHPTGGCGGVSPCPLQRGRSRPVSRRPQRPRRRAGRGGVDGSPPRATSARCGRSSTASTGRPDQPPPTPPRWPSPSVVTSRSSASSGHRSGTMRPVTSGLRSPVAACARVQSTMPRSAPISTALLTWVESSLPCGGTPPPDPNK